MSKNLPSHAPPPPYITLYDTPGDTPHPWAPNVWRIRLVLNYKKLSYRTEWIDFPDIENTLRRIGAPPTSVRSNGESVYALPVIVDPKHDPRAPPRVVSEASRIVEYLEAAYPSRPVFPEGSRAVQTLFVHWVQEVWVRPLLPIMLPATQARLSERGQAHFRAGSVASHQSSSTPSPLGFSSKHTPPPPPGVAGHEPGGSNSAATQREQAWARVKEQFDFLATVLDKNAEDGDGTVAMGLEVSYADFALCAVLIWIKRMALHDGWARVRTWNGGRWSRLLERCQNYMDER